MKNDIDEKLLKLVAESAGVEPKDLLLEIRRVELMMGRKNLSKLNLRAKAKGEE